MKNISAILDQPSAIRKDMAHASCPPEITADPEIIAKLQAENREREKFHRKQHRISTIIDFAQQLILAGEKDCLNAIKRAEEFVVVAQEYLSVESEKTE